ncbi:hypothetical protein [Photobacterium leiognathi]|uniref:hypothetical protein n=1 Tax=Photobacterium leiognathi TaxID=553611 RepID=UPI002739B91A|nr:hypothetical protein [Photobacterium leiognathi]
MKKILFYIPSLYPSGSIERVVTTIANQLCTKYNITILTKDNKKSFYDLDDRVDCDSLNYNYELNMESKFQRIISQSKNLVSSVRMIAKYLKK